MQRGKCERSQADTCLDQIALKFSVQFSTNAKANSRPVMDKQLLLRLEMGHSTGIRVDGSVGYPA